MIFRTFFVFLILCVFSLDGVWGQEWKQFSVGNLARDMAETTDAYWFATSTGIIEMDKTTLDTIQHQVPYFNASAFTSVLVDADGDIWVGNAEDGFAEYDGVSWVRNQGWSEISKSILDLDLDHDGNVLISLGLLTDDD
ncbi:MAG: two-component regulator propeller domain-containing protein, partial [Bacteroidota bacterium]